MTTPTIAARFHHEWKISNSPPQTSAENTEPSGQDHQDADSQSGPPASCDQGWIRTAPALADSRDNRAALPDANRAAVAGKSFRADRAGNRDHRAGESGTDPRRAKAAQLLAASCRDCARPQLRHGVAALSRA